jgi:hypothetical protein
MIDIRAVSVQEVQECLSHGYLCAWGAKRQIINMYSVSKQEVEGASAMALDDGHGRVATHLYAARNLALCSASPR